jgi:hypothetical protein
MAFEDERYEIFRHLSSLYQDMVYEPDLTIQEREINGQVGDEFAEFLIDSLSMEILGKDDSGILVRIKPLGDTSAFVDDFVSKPLVEGNFD